MTTIREAWLNDEAAVTGLWKACGLVVSYNDPREDFRRALSNPSSTILIADDGVGSVMVGFDGHRGWIYYVAVHPSQRKTGLGRSLVEAAHDWLRQRGVVKCQLLIREDNEAVAAFYKTLGYDVTPRVVMARWL